MTNTRPWQLGSGGGLSRFTPAPAGKFLAGVKRVAFPHLTLTQAWEDCDNDNQASRIQ